MAADQGLIDSVSNANIKSFGDGPAFLQQIMLSDAVAHQRTVNSLREALLGSIGKRIVEMDTSEAAAESKVNSSDLPAVTAQLGSVVAALQQLMKGAQTTPPVTAP